MKPTTSNEIRKAFLDFFAEHQHEIVASSPLPNLDNPTLLFTNAGMNQFVDVFLGNEKRSYTRAATAQKVMRVQGKHNDLENVGPSPRHHTFFEMLGNFSFGDYFKREAIDFAWQFVTGVLGLEPERLWATIYLDDDESFVLWQRYLPAEKILRFNEKDNFWAMGDTGPCGPNSEMFYYVGDMATCDPSRLNADDDEEFLEFWNLVFMQFDRQTDGTLVPLPKPSVDTGMGLERMVRILQHAHSTYETDLFTPALDEVQKLLGDSDAERAEKYVGYRVIADHGRAATFLIGDGVLPGNAGRGYVLRMIIRRAARFGRKIGFTEPFLAKIAKIYVDLMGEAYPELVNRQDFIFHTLTQEEERFSRTLDLGVDQLNQVFNMLSPIISNSAETMRRMSDTYTQQNRQIVEGIIRQYAEQTHNITQSLRTSMVDNIIQRVLPGNIAFDLYATHGLPLEITRDIAVEQGFSVDAEGYERARADHALASGSGAFSQYVQGTSVYGDLLHELVGNGRLSPDGVDHDPYSGATLHSEIAGLVKDGAVVSRLSVGDKGDVVTPATPFYVESGGEVSDSGWITVEGGKFRVDDVRRPVNGLIIHVGEMVEGEMAVGKTAVLQVDNSRRADIRRNHTATHILHRELRAHLGTHVTQAGSLVAPDRLRFDFAHGQAVGKETLAAIERDINEAILANMPITIRHMGQKEAIDAGAMALFGEKYGDIVRTVNIGNPKPQDAYSFELCGGLHVSETGEIGAFRFVNEGAVAAGVRRVEAVTGRGVQALVSERFDLLDRVAHKLNAPLGELERRLDAMLSDNRSLQKELERLQREAAKGQLDDLLGQIQLVNGVQVLAAQVSVADVDGLREMADWFRDKVGSGTAVFGAVINDKPMIVATVTDDVIKRGVKAGDIVRDAAKIMGGGGGGRPNLAQAGGKDVAKLGEALTAVVGLVEAALK
ncbi:MAG: alanine--tRNA ligase [Anaerolineales bacterium]|nr:alanine--tRNA ligase [Anaerolineales bacterium]